MKKAHLLRCPQQNLLQLVGIRVVEAGTLLPGSEAASILKRLGATVVRVVPPAAGSAGGGLPAPFLKPLNKGKQVLSLDLGRAKDHSRLEKELGRSDILILGFRPASLEKLGLSLSHLRRRFPKLIICSITGFPPGPYEKQAGHDLNYLALSGLLGQNARPGQLPVTPPVPLADLVGGAMNAVIRCLAGLVGRRKTGKGTATQVCMTEEVERLLDFKKNDFLSLLDGTLPRYNIYACAGGGYVSLAALEPKFWRRFCDAVGRPAWKRWAETFDEPLSEELKQLFLSKPLTHWRDLGLEHDICLVPLS